MAIQVEPQVFNLIVFLLENRDKVVSRDEILNNVWKGRIVSDSSITNHIKSARTVLGDDGIKQNVIKTIHSRGYQFVAELKEHTVDNKRVSKRFNRNQLILVFTLIILVVLIWY